MTVLSLSRCYFHAVDNGEIPNTALKHEHEAVKKLLTFYSLPSQTFILDDRIVQYAHTSWNVAEACRSLKLCFCEGRTGKNYLHHNSAFTDLLGEVWDAALGGLPADLRPGGRARWEHSHQRPASEVHPRAGAGQRWPGADQEVRGLYMRRPCHHHHHLFKGKFI